MAAPVGITERAAQGIISDLVDAGFVAGTKEGRRDRYEVHPDQPLRHPLEAEHTVGELLGDAAEARGGRPPLTPGQAAVRWRRHRTRSSDRISTVVATAAMSSQSVGVSPDAHVRAGHQLLHRRHLDRHDLERDHQAERGPQLPVRERVPAEHAPPGNRTECRGSRPGTGRRS